MAARSVVDSWSVHHGLYAAIEPRVALHFSYDANRHKIAKQLLKIRNESGTEHITYKVGLLNVELVRMALYDSAGEFMDMRFL